MITLQTALRPDTVSVSNRFIDEYMPKANGEFVKVYLYLLRLLADASADFQMEQLADSLLCTEKDICRALKYWEEEGLLTLSEDADGQITGVILCMPAPAAFEPARELPEPAIPDITPEPAVWNTAPDSSARNITSAHAAQNITPAHTAQNITPDPSARNITPERLRELKENQGVIQLLYIAEQYLGKTLSPTEIQKILFFYDGLHMSLELIEYLIEYCVGKGRKSIRYMETVAMAWAQSGITTKEQAQAEQARYGKEYYTVLKAMGITSRSPVESEITYIDTWLNDYGFSLPLIQEACSRTVLTTGQPSFPYADKILSGWKKERVCTLEDIRVLDARHKQRQLEKGKAAPAASKAPNRFHNFQQRSYNFDEYEKKLLNQ